MLGINYNPDNSVTLVLHEKDKDGMKYDYCYLISELSGWKINGDYAMKRDEKAGCWWITLDGLGPDKEYMYQYHVGNEEGSFRVCDPYSEITYDPWNDPYISSTYPDLPEYPSGATGLVSAFRINRPAFRWDDFSIEDDDDIVIYELLLRDFTSTKDMNGALSRISYLKDLGVNAIELMPVQEFDGNLSWGYNPNSYFAMDKAYGTREMYKTFINECHKAGLAVLLDVVYNHATGIHPMAALYWNTAGNETAANNPWFNVSAPHPYNVFHDWNHENQTVRDMVKRNLTYLMDEYNVDGFRFDMTKGFTQRQCTENNASDYDAGRIAILKDYNSAIRAHNPDAVVILEHFCEWKEEKELAEAGMKVWRNMNYAYCQSAMGWSEGSDFSGLYSGTANMPFGSLVGFMESHDEERTAYKQTAYGNGNLKTDLAARMQREELNAAFFLTVPESRR